MRGAIVAAFALVATLVVTLVATMPPEGAAAEPGGLLSPGREYHDDFPDPQVLAVGGTYFAYSTTSGGLHVPMLRSLDLRSWYVVGDALPTLPGWAADHDIWSPAVVPIAGRYALYYAAPVAGTEQQCISVAFASAPQGPFVDTSSAPLVCSADHPVSIDPDPFVDPNGSVWLLWKTEPHGSGDRTWIRVQQMSADGTQMQGAPTALLAPGQAWEGSNVEAPAMLSVNGAYLLMYSANAYYSSKYTTGYALCLTVTGPCLKAKLPLLQSTDWMRGPGGASFFEDAGGHLNVAYHYWTAPAVGYPAGRRRLRITEVAPSPFGLLPGATPTDLPSFKWATSVAPSPTGDGYLVAWSNGGVDSAGDAGFAGSVGGLRLASPIVGVAPTPAGDGYWTVAADGGVFAFGGAPFLGSLGDLHVRGSAIAIASTRSGRGYWLVTADGGIYTFGDARFFGSAAGARLNRPIVAMAATPSGNGYWLVAADGGVFTFGDAAYFGSTGDLRLNRPIVAMAATRSGRGYRFVADDGGVFAFGDAPYDGSMGGTHLNAPITAVAERPSGDGYWLLGSDGGVFAFGGASYHHVVR
ncbi:MAG: glycoside hydrolase family 43 protein [Acidimicrobiia bacterium]